MNGISSATAEITGVDQPRRVLVLRHGQTAHNAGGIWQGQIDTDLSDLGREQAAAAARALGGRGIDVVVASDLRRAADTARTIADVLGLEVRLDRRFREIHVGEWAGRTVAEVARAYPQDMERMRTGEDFRRGVTGESLADVADRVLPAAQEVLAALPAGGRPWSSPTGCRGGPWRPSSPASTRERPGWRWGRWRTATGRRSGNGPAAGGSRRGTSRPDRFGEHPRPWVELRSPREGAHPLGVVAQLVAHLHGMEGVRGSNPLSSTARTVMVLEAPPVPGGASSLRG